MKDGNSFGVNEITAATTALHRFLIVHLTKTLLFSVPASRFVPLFMQEKKKTVKKHARSIKINKKKGDVH